MKLQTVVENERVESNENLIFKVLTDLQVYPYYHNYSDFVAEAQLALVKADKTFNNKYKFSTHAYNTIKFAILNYLKLTSSILKTGTTVEDRKKDSKLPKVKIYEEEFDMLKSSLENDIINKIDQEIYKNKLYKALSFLSEKEQDIIKKRFWEELSFPKIAEFYNKSKQAVQQMLKRVLEKLRKFFNNVDDFGICI